MSPPNSQADTKCEELLDDSTEHDDPDSEPEYTAEDYRQLYDENILEKLTAECNFPVYDDSTECPYRMRIGTDESPLRVSQLFGMEELELAYYQQKISKTQIIMGTENASGAEHVKEGSEEDGPRILKDIVEQDRVVNGPAGEITPKKEQMKEQWLDFESIDKRQWV